MKNVVYKICTKSIPERIYIGSSKNYKKRVFRHKYLLKNKIHQNKPLQSHVNKYGIDDIYFVVIEKDLCIEDLIIKEQYYLDFLNPYFNVCKKAYSQLGVKRSEEFKKKLSERMKKSYQEWTGAFAKKNKKPESKIKIKTDSKRWNFYIISETGEKFNSIKEASEFYNIKLKTLSAQLTGQNKNKFNLKKIYESI